MADKTFRFAIGFRNALDQARYNDGAPVGTPNTFPSDVTISEFDDIKLVDRNNIQAKANIDNYTAID